MKEHLALQKSTAKLQGELNWGTDPQRYVKVSESALGSTLFDVMSIKNGESAPSSGEIHHQIAG